jgi:hypothetical protein
MHLASDPQHSDACLVVSLQGTYTSSWRLLPLAWALTKWMCALWYTTRWQSELLTKACNPQVELRSCIARKPALTPFCRTRSLENYYQESGRAGANFGLPSSEMALSSAMAVLL